MLKLAGFNSTIYSFNKKTGVSFTPRLGEGGIRRTAVGKTHMLIVTIALDIITITTDLIFTINYQEYMNRWKIPRSKSALFTCVAQQTYVDWKKA